MAETNAPSAEPGASAYYLFTDLIELEHLADLWIGIRSDVMAICGLNCVGIVPLLLLRWLRAKRPRVQRACFGRVGWRALLGRLRDHGRRSKESKRRSSDELLHGQFLF